MRGAGDTQLEIAISPLGSFCPPRWLDYVKIKAVRLCEDKGDWLSKENVVYGAL